MSDADGAAEAPDEAPDADSLARRLRAAREREQAAEQAVAEVGAERLRRLRDAHRSLTGLLDRYEDTAPGSGDFEDYMACRMKIQELEEDLAEDLPERERFADIAERFDARRLSESDFSWAREHLAPVAELVDRLDAVEEAARERSEARRAVTDRLATVEERLADLRETRALGDADLDAPVERLRDPVERYNERVATDFDRARREWPARELLELVETTAAYPLVDVRQPPADLAAYVTDYEAGTEPVETLLEYAEYSRSKLDHYVAEPMALKRHVATHRTYLTRLDAEPFSVAWPPPPAAELRFRARELVAVVERFADEETVAALHEVRAATRREDYETLRAAARARVELDATERERLRSGAVTAEIEALEADRETLEAALEG